MKVYRGYRNFRGAKGDYVGGDSCLWPVYAVVERQRFLLRQQVGIDNREIHERQRRGLRISNLISSCLVFVYFVSFAVVKSYKELPY